MNHCKTLFVIPDMQQGGAEKVVSVMANHWARQGHRVSILTFSNQPSSFDLEKSISVRSLHSAKKNIRVVGFLVNNFLRTINYIRQVRRINPDVIISFTDNANVYALLYNSLLKKPLVITQRTNPRFNTLPGIFRRFPRRIYKHAGAMVVQTAQTLDIYRDLGVRLPEKRVVIYNPLPSASFRGPGLQERKNIILAVGRLYNSHKHFDKLIDIFGNLDDGGWQLHIAGEGPDRHILEDRIREKKLGKKVLLLGTVKELSPLYQSVKIFVLTSKFEGFPNALCEAMANGCACISYDCPTGPSELINNGVNGILVEPENTEAFAVALSGLMKDDDKTQRLSTEAVKIRQLLDEDKIMAQWESLIDDVLQLKN